MLRFLLAFVLLALAVPSLVAANGQPEKVTICHAAGLADEPANWVTLTLPWVAVYGQAGHFNENGTPQAGHEEDYLGPCVSESTPTPTPTPTPTMSVVPTPTPTVVPTTTPTPSAEPTPVATPTPQPSTLTIRPRVPTVSVPTMPDTAMEKAKAIAVTTDKRDGR